MKKSYRIYTYVLMFLLIIIMNPIVTSAKTVTVTTAKEFSDNLPFTTNDVTDIILGADINVTNTVSFYIQSNSSLDLNGHTLTVDTRYDFFVQHHCRNCSMTFKDTSESKNGKIILKNTQITVQPSNGNCLNTNVIIDGGHYELSDKNTEYSIFNLYKSSGCSSYNTTENLLIKNGDFKANRIFSGGKTARVTVEELRQSRSKSGTDFVLGSFSNLLAPNTLADVIDSNSEILYDNVIETDLTENISNYKAENSIVVRKKVKDNDDQIPNDNNNSNDGNEGNQDSNNDDNINNGDNGNQTPGNDNDSNNGDKGQPENGDSINNNAESNFDNSNSGEDNKDSEKNKVSSNPNTSDNILSSVLLFVLSLAILMTVFRRKKLI